MHGAQQVTAVVWQLAESARFRRGRQAPKVAHLQAKLLHSSDAKAPQAPPGPGSPAYVWGTSLEQPLPMLFQRQHGVDAEGMKRAETRPPPGLPPPGGGLPLGPRPLGAGEGNEAPHAEWGKSPSAPRATISIADHLAADGPLAPPVPQAASARRSSPGAGTDAGAGAGPAACGQCLRLVQERSSEGSCVVEWCIDNLRSKLRVSRGFPLLSPPCEAAGLPDVRLMFEPGCMWLEYAGTASRRHRKRQPETAAAGEGANLYGAVKLKAGELGSQAGEVSFRLAMEDGLPGKVVRCSFAERSVHTCDLDSDWRKLAEKAGDCLRLRVEFL